jgi:hypothetical protein
MPFRRSVLTESEVREIYAKRAGTLGGYTAVSLARIYKVSDKTVRDIWCGRSWGRITGAGSVNTRPVGRPKGSRDGGPRSVQFPSAGRSINLELLVWARTSFVLAELWENDEILGLEV